MGRPKGGKNREWSTEEKYRIVQRVLNGEGSIFLQRNKITRNPL